MLTIDVSLLDYYTHRDAWGATQAKAVAAFMNGLYGFQERQRGFLTFGYTEDALSSRTNTTSVLGSIGRQAGIEWDRNAPERRSGSFSDSRNTVPVLFTT